MITKPMSSEKDLTGSQSVDRALKLLSLVGRDVGQGMALNDVVEQSGFNKPTTRRLLLALIRAGFIEQNAADRRYFIGEGAYVLGSLASRRFGLLQLSMESLIRISRKTEDASFLSIRRDTHSICLHREEGTYPIRSHALQAGAEHPLGVGAGSLAMLAALPDDEIKAIVQRNSPTLKGQFPRLSPEQLKLYVAATRSRCYAVNPGLIYPNSWGIGIAVKYPDGGLAGALSIAAIDSRMHEQRQSELAAILREEARRIEARLADMFTRTGTGQGKGKGQTREDAPLRQNNGRNRP